MSNLTFQPIRKAGGLVYLGLLLILVAYVVSVIRLHPTNFFGLFEDDSIYFSSAKALAQGQGYVLPSVPGTPPATKYPILYPLILSLVWRWNPSFPANVAGAVTVTVTFGIAYVIAGFFFLRRLEIFSDAETIILTAFCALHPLVLFFSGNVLSDIPFAALALTAMVLADKFLKSDAGYRAAALCSVVAGFSMLMRVFGVAVVAGILVAALAMRAWKRMVVFVACLSPFFLLTALRIIFPPALGAPPVTGEFASSVGWGRAWAYYTNYIAIWKYGVPNAHIFWAMVRNNLELVIQAPADLLLSPLLVSDTMLGRALMLLVSVFSFAGIVRIGRAKGWQAYHYVFPFFAALILCWNYSDAGNRFLLMFYFVFIAGFWIEMRHLVVLLRRATLGQANAIGERVLGAVMSSAVFILCTAIAFNYATGRRRDVHKLSDERGKILVQKQEAYQWLSGTRDSESWRPVLAVEDANLYLYSGRQSFSPVIFPTSSLYDEKYLIESIGQIMDVSHALKARFWVFSTDDFNMESKVAAQALRNCLGATGPKAWPVVFSSSNEQVVIRRLDGIPAEDPCQHPQRQIDNADTRHQR